MNREEYAYKRMSKAEWEATRQMAFKAERVQKKMANAARALAIHKKEKEARPNAVKIQPHDVDFVAMAADKAKDVNDFLKVI